MTANGRQTALLKKLKELLPGHYYEKVINAKSEQEAFDGLPTRYHRIVEQAVAELDRAGEDEGLESPTDPKGGEVPTPPEAPPTLPAAVSPPVDPAVVPAQPKPTEPAKAVPAKPLKGK